MRTIVIDTETDGLQPSDGARIFKIGIEDEEGNVRIVERSNKRGWAWAKALVENAQVDKVCHNVKFELRMFEHEGWKVAGVWHDTMLMAHILNEYEPSLSLEFLSRKYFPDNHKDQKPIKDWLRAERAKRSRVDGPLVEPTFKEGLCEVEMEIIVSHSDFAE